MNKMATFQPLMKMIFHKTFARQLLCSRKYSTKLKGMLYQILYSSVDCSSTCIILFMAINYEHVYWSVITFITYTGSSSGTVDCQTQPNC